MSTYAAYGPHVCSTLCGRCSVRMVARTYINSYTYIYRRAHIHTHDTDCSRASTYDTRRFNIYSYTCTFVYRRADTYTLKTQTDVPACLCICMHVWQMMAGPQPIYVRTYICVYVSIPICLCDLQDGVSRGRLHLARERARRTCGLRTWTTCPRVWFSCVGLYVYVDHE